MFIRLGNKLVNSRYVVEIRLRSQQTENNATLVMHDGSELNGFALQSEVEALTEQIVPAPPGFEAYREFDLGFDDDDEIPEELDWKPVVAFAVHSGGGGLDPITADDGRLNKYAVRAPGGKVHTSSEEFFESTAQYREFLCRELAKAREKAA
jgi:hypothetical protein